MTRFLLLTTNELSEIEATITSLKKLLIGKEKKKKKIEKNAKDKRRYVNYAWINYILVKCVFCSGR